MPKLNLRHGLVIALFFGGFQALMPLAGWLLGAQFAESIQHLDHWIAFVLLAFIGGKMVWEALFSREEEAAACAADAALDYKQLLMMAVATSIDALAVGVTFAFLDVAIVPAITVIGCTTFCISLAGVVHRRVLRRPAAEVGGAGRRRDPDPAGLQDPAGASGRPLTRRKSPPLSCGDGGDTV